MASPLPAPDPGVNVHLNMLSRMPSPRGKNSLRFRGKNIEEFLTEYEHFAEHANLTENKKCQEIRIYFAKREKRVLDVLSGYRKENWRSLKRELRSLYTSSSEKRTYQPRDIQRFIDRKRKITKLIHFDTYRRQFMVISASLEARNALSGYDRSDYFWSGICLASLRDTLEVELRNQGFWIDLTLPPPMHRVVEVANKFLNRDVYQPRDVNLRGRLAKSRKRNRHLVDPEDDEFVEDSSSESSSSPSEDESESSDEEEVVKPKSKGKRHDSPVKDENASKESKTEEKAVKPDENVQSNIEDLAARFKRLELQLGERAGNREGLPPKTRLIMYCIMCGKQGHSIRDCSESKFFIAQGICRMDVNNRVIMGDGTALPRAEGEGGTAKVICDRMAGIPSSSGPPTTSAANEVIADEVYYGDKMDELATLSSIHGENFEFHRAEGSKLIHLIPIIHLIGDNLICCTSCGGSR